MLRSALLLVVSVVLAGCMTARYGDVPTAVAGQLDTFKFRIVPNAFVSSEDWIYAQLKPDIEQFRIAHGYSSFVVTERMCQPMGACTYAVKFNR